MQRIALVVAGIAIGAGILAAILTTLL